MPQQSEKEIVSIKAKGDNKKKEWRNASRKRKEVCPGKERENKKGKMNLSRMGKEVSIDERGNDIRLTKRKGISYTSIEAK